MHRHCPHSALRRDRGRLPDIGDLLASQVAPALGGIDCPETRLRRAILLQALSDLLWSAIPARYPGEARSRVRHGAEARCWVDGGAALVSFEECSSAFGMSAAAMRQRIVARLETAGRSGRSYRSARPERHDGLAG